MGLLDIDKLFRGGKKHSSPPQNAPNPFMAGLVLGMGLNSPTAALSPPVTVTERTISYQA